MTVAPRDISSKRPNKVLVRGDSYCRRFRLLYRLRFSGWLSGMQEIYRCSVASGPCGIHRRVLDHIRTGTGDRLIACNGGKYRVNSIGFFILRQCREAYTSLQGRPREDNYMAATQRLKAAVLLPIAPFNRTRLTNHRSADIPLLEFTIESANQSPVVWTFHKRLSAVSLANVMHYETYRI